ncbi:MULTISPECIES: I78 family peptidase inhibitor [unclassified Pseudomonas]|uniref:I78 family peptidase inhibitor n=1 Tax=unclassified Pseudomonas TaxID=196821 RepID=UPI00257AA1B9|nr:MULTISPECIES: I78 family peptidase inhibitor [unclassified Pseudomonas]
MTWKLSSLAALISSLVLVSACSSSPESGSNERTRSSDAATSASSLGSGCNSDAAQYAVGKTATPELFKQLQERSGARITRLVRPDDAMTMDFNSERLTITTDEALVIKTARCG